jgi:FkbM family methyltransferase
MVEYYGSGQLRSVLPFLPAGWRPAWLLLGGPADGNEALTAREEWPGCRVLGVEPNPEAYEWQLANGWPRTEPLVNMAMSDERGRKMTMSAPFGQLRSGTLEADALAARVGENTVEVTTTTLDRMDEVHGPFADALLWLDVEGWELEACRGARKLFARGAVRVANVEVQSRREDKNVQLEALLASYGFRQAGRWNHSESCEDRVYVRQG